MTVLDRLGRTLAHEAGVTVQVGGDQAFTDGRVIHLPSLPTTLTEANWRVTGGLLNHESAHVLHSDFSAIPSDAMLAQVLNTLEDPRVEHHFCRRYPGGAGDIRLAHETAFEELAGRAGSLEPYQLRLLALIGRLDGLPVPAAFGTDALTWSAKWSGCRDAVLGAAETKDLLPLAGRIHQDLFAAVESPEQPKSESEATGASVGPGQPGQVPEATGASVAAQGALQEPGTTIPQPVRPVDREALLSQGMRQQVTALAAGPGYKPCVVAGPSRLATGDGRHLEDLVSRTVPGLARRLACAVQAQTQSRWIPDQQRGRIDPRRLHRLIHGRSKRLFRRLERGEQVDTAATLIMDASGSMKGSEGTAAAAAAVVARSLDRLGVSTEVLVFKGPSLRLAKAFGEPISVLAGRLATVNPTGGTPLGEVLLAAAKRLIHQPAERFLAIVVTDGQPDNVDYCAEILKRCGAVGIETIGVGIHVDISHLFNQSITIASIDQLAPALLGQVRSTLLSSRTRTPPRRTPCRR